MIFNKASIVLYSISSKTQGNQHLPNTLNNNVIRSPPISVNENISPMEQTSHNILTHQRHLVAIECIRLRPYIRIRPYSIHSHSRNLDTTNLVNEPVQAISNLPSGMRVIPKSISVRLQVGDECSALFLEASDGVGMSGVTKARHWDGVIRNGVIRKYNPGETGPIRREG